MNVQAIFKEMTPRARIALGAAVLGTILVLFFLLSLATKPSYVTVMSGIDAGKSDKVTEALAERGVAYELRDNGTSLAVEKAQAPEARIALANAGIAGGSSDKPGFELLDEQKLGSSDFQQRVTYQRALEGEIARTIGQVDGVSGAEVQLTLPEDKLFSDESRPATAAVLLAGSTSLDGTAVRGIANLVASSVGGLRSDKVTITDGTGQMLWPGAGADGGGGANAKSAAEAKYASQVESDVNDMLSRSFGTDKARVEVSADLNMDQSNKESLKYDAKGVPTEETEDTETLEGQGAGGATAGAAANIDGPAAAAGAGGSNYERSSTKRSLAVGKTITKTKVAPGAVNQMQVALLLDSKVPVGGAGQPTLDDVEAMVAAAAGVRPDRGDTITTTQLPFAATPKPEAPSPLAPGSVVDIAKYVGAGLAALVFLLLVTRSLRKREQSALPAPTWLREIESPRPLSELVASLDDAAAGKRPQLESTTGRAQLAAVAAEDPERLARELRQWMDDGSEQR